MDSRPTFYYKNNKKNPIRAGGVLFYRFYPDFEMLLIKPDDEIRYEDFGGKTDEKDKTIEQLQAELTARRKPLRTYSG